VSLDQTHDRQSVLLGAPIGKLPSQRISLVTQDIRSSQQARAAAAAAAAAASAAAAREKYID